jgi:HNH endonuclease
VAHARHEEVRARYRVRCGYCGVTEEEAGGELTVDHFIPVSAGGAEDDDNLIYACFRCNLFKADFCPSESDRAQGCFVLHPLRDDLRSHYRLDEKSGRLEALTPMGQFHLALLHLNRPALIALRLQRRYAELLAARRDLLEAENRELRAILQSQETYLTRLKSLIEGESNQPK